MKPTASHPGCLVITTTDPNGKRTTTAYLVRVVVEYGRVRGYQLRKATGELYDLAADLSRCNCPDTTAHPERPGGCKHQAALRAALKALGAAAGGRHCQDCGAKLLRCDDLTACPNCTRFAPTAA
jgi:hypothetical protein